jgi:hypothetical protein
MDSANEFESSAWTWPFSRPDLTAGLRRWLGDKSLHVEAVQNIPMPERRPSIGRLQGLRVEYEGKNGRGSCQIVLKEPHGTTRIGLAGAGRREVGVYQSLAAYLPLRMPVLVAGSPSGDWLLLEMVPHVRSAEEWTAQDYRKAVDGLTTLHDRFWSLGADLEAFPWLGRPVHTDFEVHVAAAAKAIQSIEGLGRPEPLAGRADRMRVLARLTAEADKIALPLREQPSTLLHGDYWPGNIAVQEDGEQIVYDWQLASVGPAVLDLLVFVTKSEWWFDALPVSPDDLIEAYKAQMQERTGVSWSKKTWSLLWDHALLWRFLQEWLDLLAASPGPLLMARAQHLDRIWLDPVVSAVERRLGAA